MYFDAVKKGKDRVLVSWQTFSEINNAYFEVQRSADGVYFTTITTLDGAGNSSEILEYSTIDSSPNLGVNYYRLKQVDFDGSFVYSAIKAVNFNNHSSGAVTIYPNPSNGAISVAFKKGIFETVYLYNSLGQIILEVNPKSASTINLDLTLYSNGIYYIQVGEHKVKVVKN